MDPFRLLQIIADLVSHSWLGLGESSFLGSAVNFFVYDTLKIGVLLVLINYIMAITRFYFPMEKVPRYLDQKALVWFGLLARRCTRSDHAILFLLINSAIYWFCRGRDPARCNLRISD